jgi:hypothetical protein
VEAVGGAQRRQVLRVGLEDAGVGLRGPRRVAEPLLGELAEAVEETGALGRGDPRRHRLERGRQLRPAPGGAVEPIQGRQRLGAAVGVEHPRPLEPGDGPGGVGELLLVEHPELHRHLGVGARRQPLEQLLEERRQLLLVAALGGETG